MVQVSRKLLLDASNEEHVEDIVSLKLHDKNLQNISGLEQCISLRTLDMSFNKVQVLEGLSSLGACLKELRLHDNLIRGPLLPGLAGLSTLHTLDLRGNRITSVEGLHSLRGLKVLQLCYNQLASLESLGRITALESLEISANRLSSLEGLSGCISLRTLHAPGNRLSGAALKGLARCTGLQELMLSDNSISSLQGLSGCTASLQILDLSSNRLSSVASVPERLPALHECMLRSNAISDISPLARAATSLDTLDVSFNCITDAGALVRALAPLIDLTTLMVEGNPISTHSFSSQPSAAETPVAAAAASIASTSAAAASGGVNGRVQPAGRAAASPARGGAGAATTTAKAGQAGAAGTAGGGPGTAGRLSGPGRGAVVAGSQGARYAPRNSVGQAAATSRVKPSGQAVQQESASQGPLTVQLPGQLDGTSGQAALTNQEVPSTPACGVPVMRELLNRLPGLLACDDEEQTFSAPADPRASMAQSGKGGRCSNDGGENADDFVPSAAEMDAFRTRMGIRAPIPAQLAGKAVRPGSARPVSAAGMRPGSSAGRPMSASGAGRRRVLGQQLFNQQVADFADTMATYSISLGRVLGSMKQGLRAASVADAAEALRKEGDAARQLPVIPVVPDLRMQHGAVVKDEPDWLQELRRERLGDQEASTSGRDGGDKEPRAGLRGQGQARAPASRGAARRAAGGQQADEEDEEAQYAQCRYLGRGHGAGDEADEDEDEDEYFRRVHLKGTHEDDDSEGDGNGSPFAASCNSSRGCTPVPTRRGAARDGVSSSSSPSPERKAPAAAAVPRRGLGAAVAASAAAAAARGQAGGGVAGPSSALDSSTGHSTIGGSVDECSFSGPGRPAAPMHASLVQAPGQGLGPNSPGLSTPCGTVNRPASAGRMVSSVAGTGGTAAMQQKVVLATHRPAALKGRVAGEGGQQEAGEAAASAMVASAANTPSGRHAHFQRASMQSSPLAHGLPGSVLRTDGNGGGLTAAGSSPAAVRPPARPGGIVSGGPGVGIGTRPPSPGGGGHVRIAVGGLIRKAGGAGTALIAGLKPRTGGVLGAAKQQ